jgi:aminoglycoside 3-N-acetyltransferase
VKSYTLQNLSDSLKACGVSRGDLVFLHSSLFPLGTLEDVSGRDVPARLLEFLIDYLGPGGTLGAPTFNFGFTRGEAYDRQNTPSKDMGALNEFLRQDPRARRNRHPLQSASFIGALRDELTDDASTSGYGPSSTFAMLVKKNAKLLLLGCGLTSASLIHFVEEKLSVPYRYQKEFRGPYTDNGETRTAVYSMFVRRLDMNTEVDEAQIEGWLSADEKIKRAALGGEAVRVCSFQDFCASAEKRLLANPYILLKAPPEKGT